MKKYFWILLFIFFANCKERAQPKDNVEFFSPVVVNSDDKIAFDEFKNLNLNDEYLNLLDPENSTQDEYSSVQESWNDFNQKVSKFVKKNNFKWEVSDSAIAILNRIYFNKDGNIEYYSFKILNPSVSDEKREEYGKLIFDFSESIKLDLPSDKKYAMCGRVIYINN